MLSVSAATDAAGSSVRSPMWIRNGRDRQGRSRPRPPPVSSTNPYLASVRRWNAQFAGDSPSSSLAWVAVSVSFMPSSSSRAIRTGCASARIAFGSVRSSCSSSAGRRSSSELMFRNTTLERIVPTSPMERFLPRPFRSGPATTLASPASPASRRFPISRLPAFLAVPPSSPSRARPSPTGARDLPDRRARPSRQARETFPTGARDLPDRRATTGACAAGVTQVMEIRRRTETSPLERLDCFRQTQMFRDRQSG
jgi:hypothetical protein